MISPISEYLHYYMARKLKDVNIHTLLDIGGTRKMVGRGFEVTDTNKKYGIDGRDLPFEDNFFNATISVAVLEHVGNHQDQLQFLKESLRVAKILTVHWFPVHKGVEELLASIGHKHPCIIPDMQILIKEFSDLNWDIENQTTVKQHLLLLATMYPNLNKPELYKYIFEHGHEIYGQLLIIKKDKS